MTAIEQIRGVVLDVDGVLTDGRLYYASGGETLKVFHVKDGTAIKTWQQRGLRIGFLSGRESEMVVRRASELGIDDVVQGQVDKLEAFQKMIQSWSLRPEQICYVGDDTPDLPPMRICGFAVAVADAVPEVRREARYVTEAGGGLGAVREVIDYLLTRVSLP